MQSVAVDRKAQTQRVALEDALSSGTFRQVERLLNSMPAADIAHLLESSPVKDRQILWKLIKEKNTGEVIQHLHDNLQAQFLEQLDAQEVVSLTEGLDVDDIADILQQLPDRVMQEVLTSMSSQDRHRVETVLTYDDDTAGGLMNTDTITVRPKVTLDVVLRYLRRHEALPEITDNLFVVNKKDVFLGILPLNKLLTSDPDLTVREVMVTDIEGIPAELHDSEVARLFERHDWVSAPVVSEDNKLLGRITIDDVVDVIKEDAEHSLMSMAGLDEEEDTFAPVKRATPRRAIWLGINLLTALMASAVINIFQDAIDKVVALAILMPIVASMGGVAGSQTLTVVIRGMALGHLNSGNIKWLLNRELGVGFLNGILWSLAMAIIAGWWFNDIQIAAIIAAAMVINLLTAAFAGALLPIALKAMKVDPALAGGVALTTVTDVVGFMSFLGLATAFYA
ncbi:MAG: magnesium transporter [Cellvibrionaceae bacterium]